MSAFTYGSQIPRAQYAGGMFGQYPHSVGSANGMYTSAPQYSVGSANGMYGADGMASGVNGVGGAAGAGAGGMGAAMPVLAGLQAIFAMDKENRDRKLASETQRYSPWTSLRAQPIEAANPVGDVAQGYAGYMGQQQNDEAASLRKKLTEAQIRSLDRGGNPYAMQRAFATVQGGQPVPLNGSWPMGDYNPNYTKG